MQPHRRIRHEIAYDATAAEVFAMLADPDFRRTSGAAEVEVRPAHAEGMTMRVALADGWVRTEDWVDARHATFTLGAPGQDPAVTGTRTLVETAATTTETMVADIMVDTAAPAADGGREGLADLLVQDRDKEKVAGAAWLRGLA